MQKGYQLVTLFLIITILGACQSRIENTETSSFAQPMERETYTSSSLSESIDSSIVSETNDSSFSEIQENIVPSDENNRLSHKIVIDGKEYELELFDNTTVEELLAMLPLDLVMDDLNSNEKFNYLEQNLSTNSQNINQISRGDLMLYGSNCLVLFYENFSTSYSYTPIGRVSDSSGLDALREYGSVRVQID